MQQPSADPDTNPSVTAAIANLPERQTRPSVQHVRRVADRIARLTVDGGYRFAIDHRADEHGTHHFGIWTDSVHHADALAGTVTVTPTGEVTAAWTNEGNWIGLREHTAPARQVRDAIEELASLLTAAEVVGGGHVDLTNSGHALVRALGTGPSRHHPTSGPCTTPDCLIPLAAA
ncbi:hypothetical protein AB0B28_06535 [Glycomyces sp. NPDC046736]|uniref:hypothetical protein n=1 Tax=Glycomyces sp. NPDC046736 TaxID=3155615 RepID=UPI0033CAE37E